MCVCYGMTIERPTPIPTTLPPTQSPLFPSIQPTTSPTVNPIVITTTEGGGLGTQTDDSIPTLTILMFVAIGLGSILLILAFIFCYCCRRSKQSNANLNENAEKDLANQVTLQKRGSDDSEEDTIEKIRKGTVNNTEMHTFDPTLLSNTITGFQNFFF